MGKEYDIVNDLDAYFADLEKARQARIKKILDIADEEHHRAADNLYREYAIQERRYIKRIFDDAVTQFYNAYTPTLYKDRQGDTGSKRGGLYEVLYPPRDEYGMAIDNEDEYKSWFDRNRLHKGRNRKTGSRADLFDLVFMQGWHGGAMSIDSRKEGVWGAHPPGNDPYYRTSGFVTWPDSGKRTWHRWGAWGDKAARSESPYEIFRKNYNEADQKLFMEFKKIGARQHRRAVERIQRRIDAL